jgi:hypothetical protein
MQTYQIVNNYRFKTKKTDYLQSVLRYYYLVTSMKLRSHYLFVKYSNTFFSMRELIFEISAFMNFSPIIFSYNSI